MKRRLSALILIIAMISSLIVPVSSAAEIGDYGYQTLLGDEVAGRAGDNVL